MNEDWCEGTLCKIQRRAIRVVCLQKSRKVVPSFGIGSGGQYTVAAAARSNPPTRRSASCRPALDLGHADGGVGGLLLRGWEGEEAGAECYGRILYQSYAEMRERPSGGRESVGPHY